jgi:hypothetical protein
MKYRLPLDTAYGEFIFAPFHDPEHAPWLNVHVLPEGALEITRESLWDSTVFSWPGGAGEAKFVLKLFCPFDTPSYDTLVGCLSLPHGAQLEVALIDEANEITGRWLEAPKGAGVRQEHHLRLADFVPAGSGFAFRKAQPRPTSFGGVALRVTAPPGGLPLVSLNWLGLRNEAACELAATLPKAAAPDWSPWILPDEHWGEVRFTRGLLFDADDLAGVRARLADPAWAAHFALLESRARGFMERDPEAMFGAFLPNHDARYIRSSQHGRTAYHWESLVVAFVGLVRQDRAMIRHALRYLMCMVHTPHWTESGEHSIPSSTWTHLSFHEEMTTTAVALLADWLGFALFPRALNLARRALYERGVAAVARDLATRPALHAMNQGAVFNRAVILGGLMLEQAWPHYGQHTVDKAWETMRSVLDTYVKPDGGVHEGFGYLCQTMTATLWGLIAYGRARGRDWRADVRRHYERTSSYVAVMSSLDPGRGIPSGDCRTDRLGGDPLPIMAALCPDSAYAHILEAGLVSGSVHDLTGTLSKSGGLVGMVYGPQQVAPSRNVVPAAALLPDSGKATLNLFDDAGARIWMSGAAASGGTHVHRDIGEFVLEVQGQSIFVDRGMVQYWYAEAHVLSRSWVHNVLTPVNAPGDYQNQLPPTLGARVSMSADAREVRVPGCDVWKGRLDGYERRFFLQGPGEFEVEDAFTAVKDDRVSFNLHSPHRFEAQGQGFALKLDGWRIEVSCPWAQSVHCEQALIDWRHQPVYHLRAEAPVGRGEARLRTRVRVTRVAR